MNDSKQDKNNLKHESEIDLIKFLKIFWQGKFLVFSSTIISLFIAIIYALNIPNVYKADALLMPQEDENRMGGMYNQYSAMASLAGISLESSGTKSLEAISRMKSYEFFSNNFLPKINLENLMASKGWDASTKMVIYDDKIYLSNKNLWIGSAKLEIDNIPTPQKAYDEYMEILSINENKKTSFITVSVEHHSPYIANKWVTLIINEIDKTMRDHDKKQATKSIEYLQDLSKKIKYEEIRDTVSSLQEEQMKKLMMVEASDRYIFKVLDPPIVPEEKYGPRRSVIVIWGGILGFILGGLIVLSKYFYRKKDL